MSRRKLILSAISLIISIFLFYQGLNAKNQLLNSNSTTPTISASPEVESASTSAVALSPIPSGFTKAQVVRVVDGDTIEVSINGQNFKLRYIGVNTPETVDPRRGVQCFGHEASDANKKLVEGKIVYLEKDISETDKFDRLLRYVFLPTNDGLLFVNDYLVREGYAQINTYPPDVKYVDRYTKAQTEARTQNKGLWAKCNGQI